MFCTLNARPEPGFQVQNLKSELINSGLDFIVLVITTFMHSALLPYSMYKTLYLYVKVPIAHCTLHANLVA